MSSTPKKQRQKTSVEHIIPIEIEDDTDDNDEMIADMGNSITITPISPKDSRESLNPSSSIDLNDEDNNISSSVCKMELSDTSEVTLTEIEPEIDIKIPERMLPPYNVPEKIIIILDRAEDEVSTSFELQNGTKLKPLDMLKDSLKFFLHTKSSIDPRHEFALMTLNENSATWVSDFTSNVRSLIEDIDEVEECHTEDIFDMTTVFDSINDKIKMPPAKSDLIIPPSFVVRSIFLYNRSITMPEIKMSEEIKDLLESPYFTFDVALTHEIPDSSNKCQLIFEELEQLDTKGFAYFFPITRDANMLYVAMAKLLSHPLQRCRQKDANYKFSIFN